MSGRRVAELEQVCHGFDGKTVLRDVNVLVSRGDRIGIVGPNGSGKSTLLKILLGELQPDSGKVTRGTRLEVAYFDQLRAQLDPEKNLIDNVCGGREFIEIDGKRRHAISWLGDFLFGPDRVRTPVRALSGGEQNRAILAKLFSKPANLLVLDEPTNDLDVETLELLEEILLDFPGTVLLVSHDRAFMDNVVTSILVLEGDGRVSEHVGGYGDWVARGGRLAALDGASEEDALLEASPDSEALTADVADGGTRAVTAAPRDHASAPERSRKLSYKDQRELDALPERIEALEARLAEQQAAIAEPAFYSRPHEETREVLAAMADLQAELEAAYARWEELLE